MADNWQTNVCTMQRTSKLTVKPRETVRLDDDVKALITQALKQSGWKNKNRLFNSALRHSLARFSKGAIQLETTAFERRVFGEEKNFT